MISAAQLLALVRFCDIATKAQRVSADVLVDLRDFETELGAALVQWVGERPIPTDLAWSLLPRATLIAAELEAAQASKH